MTEDERPTPEQRRLSFGQGAEAYDRFRPTYPAAAVEFVLGKAPLRVVDLAAGTGKLTRRVRELGHEVIAVEPDEQMLAVLRASNEIEAHQGTAEAIPLADGCVDAVVVGQAFHWFDREKALTEIARVLRPSGTFGLFWNLMDDRTKWVAAIGDLTTSEARTSLIDSRDDPDLSPWFADLTSGQFTHRHGGSLDDLLGEVSTWSYVYLHPNRDEILARVQEIATTADLDGDYSVPYVTRTFRAERRCQVLGEHSDDPLPIP